ncbi:MAG: flagellar motor protein, partial [Pseudomonadales bacterium]|nr:flagellar motor protein [Pseudomonadales bacterium]
MDFLSVLGVILAFGALIGGNYLEGGHVESLLNFPAALIVIGGTFAAICIQSSFGLLMLSLKRL